jgi:hypothetical protein
MADERSRDGASGTLTSALVLSNTSALPNFPAAVRVIPPASAPVLAKPEASSAVPPLPSSKP